MTKSKNLTRCQHEGGGNMEVARCENLATHVVIMFKINRANLCAAHARDVAESFPLIASRPMPIVEEGTVSK